ncbi:MAG: outer membrane beta-barrel protein [Vicinamibacterales bacterium]
MRVIRLMSLATVVLLLGSSSAHADGHVNLFLGSNFFGDAGRSLNQALNDGSRLTWGADIGGMTKGIVGAEFDIAYARHFFGDNAQLGGNYVLTAMPAIIIGVPISGERGGGIRPFATAGFGLIRRNLEIGGAPAIKDNGLGYSLGFGINGYTSSHFGVRADYRYFRNVEGDPANNLLGIDVDPGTFSFSRGSIGAVFRF